MPLGRPTSLAAHVFVGAAIASRFAAWLKYDPAAVVLKCVPVAVLMWAVWAGGRRDVRRVPVVAGLGLSMVGDGLLAWPADLFVGGLVAFLLAHVAYIVAFVRLERRAAPGWAIPFALVGGGVFFGLMDGLGALLAPVAVYVTVIATMAWRAGALAGRVAGGGAALLGASLFLVSDSVLAINKFGHSFRYADELVMVTYWAAQFWIARSAMPEPDAR